MQPSFSLLSQVRLRRIFIQKCLDSFHLSFVVREGRIVKPRFVGLSRDPKVKLSGHGVHKSGEETEDEFQRVAIAYIDRSMWIRRGAQISHFASVVSGVVIVLLGAWKGANRVR